MKTTTSIPINSKTRWKVFYFGKWGSGNLLGRILLALSTWCAHVHYESNRLTYRLYKQDRSPLANNFWQLSVYLNYLWFKLETPELGIYVDKTDPWCWRTVSHTCKPNFNQS